MKSCLNCGTEAEDDVANCVKCYREFTFRGKSEPILATVIAQSNDYARPNGKLLIGVGWVAFGFGIIASLLSLSIDTAPYGTVDLNKVATSWNLLIGGGALAQAGFMLLLAGVIVRAIWFLPSRGE